MGEGRSGPFGLVMRSPVRSDTGRKLFISYFDPRHRCTTTADLRITCISRGDRRRRRTVPPRARSRDHTCGATTFSLRLFSRVRFSLSPPSPSSSIVHSPFGRSSDRTCVVPAAAVVVELSSVPSIDLKYFYYFFSRNLAVFDIIYIYIYYAVLYLTWIGTSSRTGIVVSAVVELTDDDDLASPR